MDAESFTRPDNYGKTLLLNSLLLQEAGHSDLRGGAGQRKLGG